MYWKQIEGIALSIFLSCCVFAGEPSAFESQSGATKKDIKNLKDSSLNLSSIIIDLQGRLETLEQVQHGLQSLYDGQNQKVQKIVFDLENNIMRSEEMQARLDILKEQLNQFSENQKKIEQEQQRFVALFEEIEKKIRDVSQVSSDLNALVIKEFEGIREELKKQADLMLSNQDNIQKLGLEIERIYADKKKEQEKNAFKRYEKKSEVLKEARKLYWDKQFDEAKIRFSWLVEQSYQKAESNFFLGQIAFRQQRYEDAIFYYKESATLDDRAEYMPILLLHTIKSFYVLKNKKNALKFIDSLLVLYPKSKEAKEAKQIQLKLKGEKKNGK